MRQEFLQRFHLIMAQLGQSLIQKSLLGLEQNEQELEIGEEKRGEIPTA